MTRRRSAAYLFAGKRRTADTASRAPGRMNLCYEGGWKSPSIRTPPSLLETSARTLARPANGFAPLSTGDTQRRAGACRPLTGWFS